MKKILMFIFMFLVFCLNANALELETINIPNYYVLYDDIKTTFKVFKERENGDTLFSINLYNNVTSNKLNSVYIDYQWLKDIDEDKVDNIQDILYVGNYNKGLEGYILSQYLVWKELGYNFDIQDNAGNSVVNLFKDEYAEYLKRINEFYLLPSYFEHSIEFNYGDNYKLIDNNFLENNYIITPSTYLRMNEINNDKYIYGAIPTQTKLLAINNEAVRGYNKLFSSGDLKFINNLYPVRRSFSVSVNIHGGKIKIINVDEFGNPIEGNTFKLFNKEDKLVTSLKTAADGEAITSYIPNDEYYLLEETISEKYVPFKDKIKVDFVDYTTTDVVLKYEIPKYEVKINLNYKSSDNEHILAESNVVFRIYQEDILLEEKRTNHEGVVVFNLPIGEYRVKQINTNQGFELMEEDVIIDGSKNILINKINIKGKDNVSLNNSETNDREESKEAVQDITNDVIEEVVMEVPPTKIELTMYVLILVGLLFFCGIIIYVK